MTATPVGEDMARIVARLAELNARIAELGGEAEGLKAELRALPAGEYAAGSSTFKIIPTRRFDPVAAMAAIPEAVRAECLTWQVDPAKVKAHLTPAQLETFMVESGKPKVVLS